MLPNLLVQVNLVAVRQRAISSRTGSLPRARGTLDRAWQSLLEVFGQLREDVENLEFGSQVQFAVLQSHERFRGVLEPIRLFPIVEVDLILPPVDAGQSLALYAPDGSRD